jgi:tetratricopeptide (TPR) repeat protein
MRLYCLLLLLVAVCSAPSAAAAERRVALVIGNNAYTGLGPLNNARADADRMIAILLKHGFEVISCDGQRPGCFDLSHYGLKTAVSTLRKKSAGADLAFVYYAGHGMESDRRNLLAAVDAGINCSMRRINQGLPVDEMLEAAKGAKEKIIVLDACRNNAVGENCPKDQPLALSFRGLPKISGALLFTSTLSGQVASDGMQGQHSPFARALFANLEAKPNARFIEVFNRTAADVANISASESADGLPRQMPELSVPPGQQPESCLAGKDCSPDSRVDLADLRARLAREREIREITTAQLSQLRVQLGRELTEHESRELAQTIGDAVRDLAARNDERSRQAVASLKAGDDSIVERLYEDTLKESEALVNSGAPAAALARKDGASAARQLASLTQSKSLVKAVEYYRRASALESNDAATWIKYARTARTANLPKESKEAFEKVMELAVAGGNSDWKFSALLGLGDLAREDSAFSIAQGYYSAAKALAEATAPPTGSRGRLGVLENRFSIIYTKQGRLSDALAACENSLKIANLIAQEDPSNLKWQRDLAIDYYRIGEVLSLRGDLPNAKNAFNDAIKKLEPLVNLEPDKRDWHNNLSASYAALGNVLKEQGNPHGAIAEYKKSLEIGTRLADWEPENAAWQRGLSQVHIKIGELRAAQGGLPEALDAYENARAILEDVTKKSPAHAEWRRDLAEAHLKTGDALLAQGNLPEAAKAYSASSSIRKELVDHTPDNAIWQRDLAEAHIKTGDLLKAQGKLLPAKEAYDTAFAIRSALSGRDEENAIWLRDLAEAYVKTGDVFKPLGKPAERKEAYRNALAIRERLANKDPENAVWQRDLSEAYIKNGDALATGRAQPEALIAFRSSLAIRERLADRDPGNAGAQQDLAIVHYRIGSVHLAQKDPAGAMEAYGKSLAIGRHLAQTDPSNAGWQRDLAVSHNGIGNAHLAQANLSEAEAAYHQSFDIFQRLAKTDPTNTGWQRDLAVGHSKLAKIHMLTGERDMAEAAFKEGKAIMERMTQISPEDTMWQDDLAWLDGRVTALEGERPRERMAMTPALPPLPPLPPLPSGAPAQGAVAMARPLPPLPPLTRSMSLPQGNAQAPAAPGPAGTKLAENGMPTPEEAAKIIAGAGLPAPKPQAQPQPQPRDPARSAPQAAFDAGDFRKAAAMQADAVKAADTAAKQQNSTPGHASAAALLRLSYYRLFTREFTASAAASDRAAAIEPANILYATNKAHALMFLGKAVEARALYLKHKGRRVAKGRGLWEEEILGDFAELEKRGLMHPQMAEIKALLTARKAAR